MKGHFTLLILSGLIGLPDRLRSEDKPALEIWLDADFTNYRESSVAIEMGAQLAIENHGSAIQGRQIIIKRVDHRGNSKRSKRNIQSFKTSEQGLAMMSGIHSPPLLAHRKLINEEKVPFLVPWAAAGPITRAEGPSNYIFRLSIDDSKAGIFLSNYAARTLKSTSPCLLLEDTGWGTSNLKTMGLGFQENKVQIAKVVRFQWGIKSNQAKHIAAKLYDANCDLILLVANSKEGAILINALAHHPEPTKIPVLSHWGITGGDFHEVVPHSIRSLLNLKFIQTSFNFNQIKSTRKKQVFDRLIQTNPDIRSSSDIKAGTGVSHAYDLTSIVLLALQSMDLSQPITKLREQLKHSLETKPLRFDGLVKSYKNPFKPYRKDNPDAHEALTLEDFAIGYYSKDNVILNVE
ncbi:ABC transporter substrate-binding protein [Pseudobacteriovorax antillogorgiicola]|uniref:Amino acid/amide ABC transporter substrate-binding protein, HAAT family n=1 Tax=Pseudobacteriovorax antillogorgiicola TaxID=1513793 RepID=A0A1Y6CRH6_9BACT|nr:ABC transporter substrate-binding protein [Pseudobacteriovorax antillogorgiicola]TCS45391.1 amino acid/amide ABC transporter substrate-binding protein (HAAT family) [Pseudobacteriovorax antillogorgiicola]SMF73791.1 amino acid/amide ABC transporter substrate-binding protein, HAAT family [Pseudobacteriovorax antillogorgiicola]